MRTCMWCEGEITDNMSHFCRLVCFEEYCAIHVDRLIVQGEEE